MKNKLIKDKKGNYLNLIVGTLIFLLVIFFGSILYQEIKFHNNACLRETAKEYCEAEGFVLGGFILDLNPYSFSCYLNERSIDTVRYKFLDEEIEECLG